MFELIMCDPRSSFGGTERGDAIECNLSIIIIFSFFETLLSLFSFVLFFLCTPCHKYLISFVVCFFRFVFLAKTTPESSLDRCKSLLFIFILCLFGRQPGFNPMRWLKETVETQEGKRFLPRRIAGELADVIEIEWDGISAGVAMNKQREGTKDKCMWRRKSHYECVLCAGSVLLYAF